MGLMLGSKYEDESAALTAEQVIDALSGRLKGTRVLIEDTNKNLYQVHNIFMANSLIADDDSTVIISAVIISALDKEGL